MASFSIEDVVGAREYGKCYSKKAYTHRKYAAFRAKQAYKDGCKRGYVYKCPVCHLWHVSSMRHEDDGTGRACDGRQR